MRYPEQGNKVFWGFKVLKQDQVMFHFKSQIIYFYSDSGQYEMAVCQKNWKDAIQPSYNICLQEKARKA